MTSESARRTKATAITAAALLATALGGSAAASSFLLDEAIDDYNVVQVGGTVPSPSSSGGYRTDFILEESYHDYDSQAAVAHNDSLGMPQDGIEEAEFAVFEELTGID